MVEDVFATMKRQVEAGDAGDYEDVWRLLEVETALAGAVARLVAHRSGAP